MIRRLYALSARQLLWLPGGVFFLPATWLVSAVLAVVMMRGGQGEAPALSPVELHAAVVVMTQCVPIAVGVLVVLIDEVGRSSRTVCLALPMPTVVYTARLAWVVVMTAAWGAGSTVVTHLVAWVSGGPDRLGWVGLLIHMAGTALYSVGLGVWSAACARIIRHRAAAMSGLVAVACMLAPIAASMVEFAHFLPGMAGRCLLLATDTTGACNLGAQGGLSQWALGSVVGDPGPWALGGWALAALIGAYGLQSRQDA